MRVFAPAKINLFLRVGRLRDDGFHPLVSWMVTVGLFDMLDISPADQPGVRLSCDDPSLACDGTNLVVKVATGLVGVVQSHPGREGTSVGISAALQKRIPIGAGLGGGSSDGAAALIALNRLWRLGWTPQQLSDFGARYGSDLPFFLHGLSSLCTGRGQIVQSIPRPAVRYAVLILPSIHVSTPAVYRRFDEMNLGSSLETDALSTWKPCLAMPASELLPRLVNDLEPPAFSLVPALADYRQQAQALLGRIVRMSGSGSTLFTLYDQAVEAEAAARQIEQRLSLRAVAVEVGAQAPPTTE